MEMRTARKPERMAPILGREDHRRLSRVDSDEEGSSSQHRPEGVREGLHSCQGLLKFTPVFGLDGWHRCHVALNFLLAVQLLWNIWVHHRTVGLFVRVMLELAPTPTGPDGAFVHFKDHGPIPVERAQQPVDFLQTALASPDFKSQVRSALGTVAVCVSVLASFLGCFTLQWARKLLDAEDVRGLYEKVVEEELSDDDVRWWHFLRRIKGRTVAERMARYAVAFMAMALCGGGAMSLICWCLELHVPGVRRCFLLPWIWSVVLSRPCVHAIWCAMKVGKAKAQVFCRELQEARAEDEAREEHTVGKGFFARQLRGYLELDEDLMRLCNACLCVLVPTLPVFALGFYCSVMATFWTGKLEYKVVLTLMAFGFFLSVVEVLWPMGALSDACCLTKTQGSVQSIKDEVVRCGGMTMDAAASQEYLRLLAVVKASPIGAKLPLLGLVRTADLYHMALLILPTLPTLVALA